MMMIDDDDEMIERVESRWCRWQTFLIFFDSVGVVVLERNGKEWH
jgi:hypothetical protein